jgi:hypothetical protein
VAFGVAGIMLDWMSNPTHAHNSILALAFIPALSCGGADSAVGEGDRADDVAVELRGGASNVRQLPTAVSRRADHLDLFITGYDGRVYTSWWHEGNAWSGIHDNWASIGGFFPPGAPISAVTRNPDHLDLFITGNDGRVYTSWWHQGSDWSGIHDNWASIGGFFPPGAPVTALARNPDHLDLFVTGNDGRV